MRWIHIACGLTGITTGTIALIALKGGTLHRRAGVVFVYAMLVMSSTGAYLALARPNLGNVIAGTLTFYMVTTAVLTVRPASPVKATLERGAMAGIFALGALGIAAGLYAMTTPSGRLAGYPPPLYFFGAVSLMFGRQDRRMFAAGGVEGTDRLRRHLGRMSGAMLIATASFFVGQPRVFSDTLLEPMGLRALPVLAVIGAMVYWRRRLRAPHPSVVATSR